MRSRARGRHVLLATPLMLLVACAGPAPAASDAVASEPAPAASIAPPGTSAAPAASRAPEAFPIPVPEGGTLVSQFPGEVTFEYPSELYDALVRFYDGYAETVDVISAGELFPAGYAWQLEGEGGMQEVTLTDDGSTLTLFLRVSPR